MDHLPNEAILRIFEEVSVTSRQDVTALAQSASRLYAVYKAYDQQILAYGQRSRLAELRDFVEYDYFVFPALVFGEIRKNVMVAEFHQIAGLVKRRLGRYEITHEMIERAFSFYRDLVWRVYIPICFYDLYQDDFRDRFKEDNCPGWPDDESIYRAVFRTFILAFDTAVRLDDNYVERKDTFTERKEAFEELGIFEYCFQDDLRDESLSDNSYTTKSLGYYTVHDIQEQLWVKGGIVDKKLAEVWGQASLKRQTNIPWEEARDTTVVQSCLRTLGRVIFRDRTHDYWRICTRAMRWHAKLFPDGIPGLAKVLLRGTWTPRGVVDQRKGWYSGGVLFVGDLRNPGSKVEVYDEKNEAHREWVGEFRPFEFRLMKALDLEKVLAEQDEGPARIAEKKQEEVLGWIENVEDALLRMFTHYMSI